jgi:magnesium and cobalt transporter
MILESKKKPMNDDRTSSDPSDKSWIEKIAQSFSAEPKTRGDILEMLKIAQERDVIDADVLSLIEGAMEVGDLQVREVMVPRSQIVAVKIDSSAREFLPKIIKSGHSRFPVVGESIDELLGILLAKDLLPLAFENRIDEANLHTLIRPVTKVPESKRLNVLLKEFREQRNHIAIVIGEYGGVSGLITIEDVLEEIVGDIEDEFDETTDPFIKKLTDSEYIVKALTPIEDFNEEFDSQLDEEEFDTIGGLIMHNFGHVPRRNEITDIGRFRFKVLISDSRRIHLLRMSLLDDSDE